MKMRKMLSCLTLIAIVGLVGCDTSGHRDAERAAIDSAEAWLELVDEGDYAGSWDAAAGHFKSVVEQGQWMLAMESSRRPFGKNISRKLLSKTYSTTLPGAPDGEYVVIQYEASFENKASAVETITPMLDKDGKWRVSGYFMK
jgi:hypothetical protein